MRSKMTRLAGAVLLIGAIGGSAVGQNLGSMTSATAASAQLQNLQHSAIKMAEVGAGVGLGMTVIGLALHARHHSVSSKRGKKEAANNIDYKALSEQYARQLDEMRARPAVPAATALTTPAGNTPGQRLSTAAPASLPLQPQASNVAPPAPVVTPQQ